MSPPEDGTQPEGERTRPAGETFWKRVGRWAKRVGLVVAGLVLTLAVRR